MAESEVIAVSELLYRGLIAGQYPRNFKTNDLYAFDPEFPKVVNIQIKYRHASKDTAVDIKDASKKEGVEFFV